jgi:hypothetical protein
MHHREDLRVIADEEPVELYVLSHAVAESKEGTHMANRIEPLELRRTCWDSHNRKSKVV